MGRPDTQGRPFQGGHATAAPGRPPLLSYTRMRRGGRAVECSGLENRRGRQSTVGSNPTPSANLESKRGLRRPLLLCPSYLGKRRLQTNCKAHADVAAIGVGIDQLDRANLEAGALGRWPANSVRPVEAAVRLADAAIRGRQQERAEAEAAEAALIHIRVRAAFRSIGGRQWESGDYCLNPEEWEHLSLWLQREEAFIAEHEGSYPAGLSAAKWPPFEITATK